MPLTGVPAAMLGLPVPVEAVWGAIAKELADQLDSAATPGAMLDILEAALLARLRPVAGLGLVHDTSTQFSQSAGSLSIASLTEAAGVSGTHLAARFKHLVGITPKRLVRTYRFAEVVNSINPACAVDWAQVAHRAGYHDQLHFNHELRQFTGLTPHGVPRPAPQFRRRASRQRSRRRAAAARLIAGLIFYKPARSVAGQYRGMSKVIMQTIVSVDGFIATEDDQVGPLFDWFETGDTPLYEHGPLVTKQSHAYYRPMLDAIGALVVAGTAST